VRPKPSLPNVAAALAALGLLSATAVPLTAHGPDHAFILALTEELGRRPGDADLLLQRGERYRSHGDLPAARTDLEAALAANPALQPARLRLALVARDQDHLDEALTLLDATLATESTNLLARSTRADVRLRAGRAAEAIADFDRVLADSTHPRPELYLARARAVLTADTNAFFSAMEGIDEGLRRLGPVPSLQLLALDLAERSGNFDAALHRLDSLMAGMERKERWLLRRGDILRNAQRHKEATQSYRQALQALDALPERLRRTIASEELRRELGARLAGNTPNTGTSPDR
jgi:tetratricopeptide (TPR) repeat protein